MVREVKKSVIIDFLWLFLYLKPIGLLKPASTF